MSFCSNVECYKLFCVPIYFVDMHSDLFMFVQCYCHLCVQHYGFLCICTAFVPFICAVMRLTKPTLMASRPLLSDDRDLCGDLLQNVNQSDLAKPADLDLFPLGDLLTLPQNFGSVVECYYWFVFVRCLM